MNFRNVTRAIVALLFSLVVARADSGSAGGISWVTTLDGEGTGYNVAFTGSFSATSNATTSKGKFFSTTNPTTGEAIETVLGAGVLGIAWAGSQVDVTDEVTVETESDSISGMSIGIEDNLSPVSFYLVAFKVTFPGPSYAPVYALDTDVGTVTVTVSVTAGGRSTKIRAINPSTVNQQVLLYQADVLVHTFSANAGATSIDTFSEWETDGIVTVKTRVAGVLGVGQSLFNSPDDYADVTLGSVSPVLGTEPPQVTFTLPSIFGPTPIDKKTLWTGTGTTLEAQLFREGVDKIVAAQNDTKAAVSNALPVGAATDSAVNSVKTSVDASKASTDAVKTAVDEVKASTEGISGKLGQLFDYVTGETVTDNSSANSTTQQSAAESAVASVVGELPTITMPTVTPPDTGTGFSLANFTILGVTFNLDPFTYWPSLSSWATVIYNIQLVGCGLFFMTYVSKKAERYFFLFMATPQSGTKPEPIQLFIPGAGWTKQAGMALTMVGVLAVAIASTVVAINLHMPTFLGSGATVTTVGPGLWTWVKNISDLAGEVGTMLNQFIPMQAMVQLLAAQWLLTWSLPGIWGLSLLYVKTVQV